MGQYALYTVLSSMALLLVAQGIRPDRYLRDVEAGSLVRQPWQDAGGYVHPKHNAFYAVANSTGTDKATRHQYYTLYGKYFQRMGGRRYAKKIMEIGLGCNMGYGPGRSSKMWRKYFTTAEIWQAEYDAKCVEKYKGILNALDINALTGDQANVTTLRRWVKQAGTDFDYIIDDGGHSQMMQFHSLIVLFVEALKPGGVYFLEDTNTNRVRHYVDGDKQHNMLDIIKDWLDLLLDNESDGYPRPGKQVPELAYKPKWPLPLGLKSIECALNMCAFVKCYADDPMCSMKVMREYKLNTTSGIMEASWNDPAPHL